MSLPFGNPRGGSSKKSYSMNGRPHSGRPPRSVAGSAPGTPIMGASPQKRRDGVQSVNASSSLIRSLNATYPGAKHADILAFDSSAGHFVLASVEEIFGEKFESMEKKLQKEREQRTKEMEAVSEIIRRLNETIKAQHDELQTLKGAAGRSTLTKSVSEKVNSNVVRGRT